MSYVWFFCYIVVVFLVRRFFRHLISTKEMKENNKYIECLKDKIKLNPKKKNKYKRLIINTRFGNLKDGLIFVFIDFGLFFFFIAIARALFNDLSYWIIIYIVTMLILGIFTKRVIKRRFNIQWL